MTAFLQESLAAASANDDDVEVDNMVVDDQGDDL